MRTDPKSTREAEKWIRADCDHPRRSCREVGCTVGIALAYILTRLSNAEARERALREGIRALELWADELSMVPGSHVVRWIRENIPASALQPAEGGPCSACGDGDTNQRYHQHPKPAEGGKR